MRPVRILPLALLAFSGLWACERAHFEVHVEPQGPVFQRSLSVTRVTETGAEPHRLSRERAERLAALYGAARFEPGQTLSATFTRATPDDLGGAGRYLRLQTPLGDLVHYQERVGGDDDLVARFRRTEAAAARAATLVAAWLASELGDAPRWAVLAPKLGEPLARDVANLCLAFQLDQGYRRPIEAGAKRSTHVEGTAARLAMYCVERGYFELEDLPVLLRAAASAGDPAEDATLEPLQRLLARGMGLGAADALPEQLAFLAGARSARASWEQFASSPQFAALTSSWPTPEGEDALMALLADLLGSTLQWNPDQLVLSVTTRGAPHWTNGTWDADESRVGWLIDVPDARAARLRGVVRRPERGRARGLGPAAHDPRPLALAHRPARRPHAARAGNGLRRPPIPHRRRPGARWHRPLNAMPPGRCHQDRGERPGALRRWSVTADPRIPNPSGNRAAGRR